ncbi:response regulator receiver protein [Azospirillum sp. TSH100]|uniref:response regulator n=1 Tax=Azospirillum sp. TSH100 TaxID=652764 RepID=UPI000D613142|nr:response regulator [Azospirillum sp. TSH100]PWC85373.1 response regulator receiver protein [Azospirillum sp. TSH100]QCG86488.1 response regulator [Azospirillum sp. TSH100]
MTSILVVDDSRLARNMVSSVIASLRPDWTIVTAASGEEGLQIVGEVPPVAAIVDYNMPGMDGLVLAERLTERFAGLPIGLLTANVQDTLKRKAEALGIRFIAKPITSDKIRDFLAAAGQ